MIDILRALKDMAGSFGKHFTALRASIDALPEKIADKVGFKKGIDEQTRVLSAFAQLMQQTAAELKDLNVEVDFDTRAFAVSLEKVATGIIAALPKAPSLENTEASLKLIYQATNENGNKLVEAVQGFTAAANKIKLNVPEVVRIDQQQVNQIAYSGAPVARRPVLSNTVIANASTQYSYTFPKGTVAWTFKLRDQGTLAYYSWKTGTLPGSGDGSLYLTVPQNFLRSQPDTDYGNLTLYFGAEGAGVAEIEAWTA